MRAQLGPFCDYDGVQVHDAQAPFLQQAAHMLQETQAVRIFPFWVRVREMRSNITETRRAQERVADGVCQGVAIGMAHRAFLERDFDAAEHELAACGEPVQVITDAGSAHRPTSAAMRSRLKSNSAISKSPGRVIFRLR